jgi:hypothetical protein
VSTVVSVTPAPTHVGSKDRLIEPFELMGRSVLRVGEILLKPMKELATGGLLR